MSKSRIVTALEKFGAKDIKGYSLISNYGYLFTLDGKRYDARYWANCYGAALDRWIIGSARAGEDGEYYQMDPETKDKIEKALNEIGDE